MKKELEEILIKEECKHLDKELDVCLYTLEAEQDTKMIMCSYLNGYMCNYHKPVVTIIYK